MTFLHSHHQNCCQFLNWHNINNANTANALLGLVRVVSPDTALIIYFETFSTSLLLSSVLSALIECHFSNKLLFWIHRSKIWMGSNEADKQTKKDGKCGQMFGNTYWSQWVLKYSLACSVTWKAVTTPASQQIEGNPWYKINCEFLVSSRSMSGEGHLHYVEFQECGVRDSDLRPVSYCMMILPKTERE